MIDYKPDLTFGDLAAIFAALLISSITAWITIRLVLKQLRDNREINASNSGITILIELRNLWRDFKEADISDKKFRLIEILDFMESVCYLYWRDIINRENSYVAVKAIEDQLLLIFKNSDALKIFETAQTAETTYINIRKFKARYIDDLLIAAKTINRS